MSRNEVFGVLSMTSKMIDQVLCSRIHLILYYSHLEAGVKEHNAHPGSLSRIKMSSI